MVNVSNIQQLKTGCVIVGGGAAGLRASIECLKNNVDTLLVTKGIVGQSHSLIARGGINAAIGQKDPTDSWEIHLKDTIETGRFINNKKMVEILCKECPQRIYDLLTFGAGFEVDSSGKPIQVAGPSGGQSKDRVVTVGDFVGFVVVRALLSEALSLGLKVMDETVVVKLVTDNNGEACGVLGYNLRNAKFVFIDSPCVILACGGGGGLFSITTNPAETTGEEYILGLEAGIELRDMEMIQFHPTALCNPPYVKGVLITEAARGIGGRLYNAKGERFMEKYDAERMELAPRDIVARAIIQEIREGRGTPNGGILLDLTHLDPAFVLNRLHDTASMLKTLYGLDITKSPIEVTPATHHFMGGLVPINLETMESSAYGIFLAGEVCWGCHGANRLGGNALAETQVFGRRAGLGAVLRYKELHGYTSKVSDTELREELQSIKSLFRSSSMSERTIYGLRRDLRELMFNKAGIMRDAETLQTASKEIERIENEFRHCRKILDNYYSFAYIFEFSKMIVLAKLVIESALCREESRGAHFRKDYPYESSDFYNTSILPSLPYKVRRVYIE
ncbi:FAD-binding protein [Dehalococcoidia bacterium]|nr:FAD-binding protein [Dehalococcoidia bacterium]MCL0064867.1 FAD-binding protein [Dehalococcoidia bacterium]